VEKGQPLATLYATSPALLAEPAAILRQAITIAEAPPQASSPLVSRVLARADAEAYLRDTVR
jgi:thymidine phosphorylase